MQAEETYICEKTKETVKRDLFEEREM